MGFGILLLQREFWTFYPIGLFHPKLNAEGRLV